MRPEHEAPDLELIVKALQIISKKISHEGLSEALLKDALMRKLGANP
jgi:hypothetical protein